MKKLFTLCMAIVALNVSYAQRESSGYAEVGINAMRLITFGMNQQANSEVWNPYLFTVEGGFKNFGARIGFSKYSYTNTEFPVDINGNNRVDTDTSSSNIRIGLFYSINPDEKWSFKIGVDYYSFKTDYYQKSDFIAAADQAHVVQETTRAYKESGFAPFINVQYHIAPRVSIGTELLFRNGNYNLNINGTDSTSSLSVNRKYEGKKSYFVLPTALFLTMRF